MRILIAVVVIAAAACSKKSSNPCQSATAHAVEATLNKRMATNPNAMPADKQKEFKTKLSASMNKACVDDKWSKEVIDCFAKAEDMGQCKDQLTAEQRANYGKAAMSVMMEMGGGGMGPGHGMGGGGGMGSGAGGGGGGADGSAAGGGSAGAGGSDAPADGSAAPGSGSAGSN